MDCFRVSILQIRDVIFGEVLATMITDIIMYILIWMLSIHLPNLIPGLITWGGQCVIGVIWACSFVSSTSSNDKSTRGRI